MNEPSPPVDPTRPVATPRPVEPSRSDERVETPSNRPVEPVETPSNRPVERVETSSNRPVERVETPSNRPVERVETAPHAEPDDLLVVDDLKVHFPIKRGVVFDRTIGHVQAVDGVSLRVRRGSTYGLVGESGCGKSTFGRAVLRLEEPTGGVVTLDGTDVTELKGEALRQTRRRMQMVFQDPLASLDPRQSVLSLMIEPLRVHDPKPQAQLAARAAEMLELVGMPRSALAKYPHEFSGGQRQRIGIARAMILNPELVIADEPVSALDVSVQAQVINLLEKLQDEFGLTYIVIAHDLAVVRHISDRVGVMYLGKLVEEADSDDLYATPLHPYTIALMSAIPIPDPAVEDRRERILLRGDLPSPANPPSGCRFHTRCPYRQPTRCDTEVPQLRVIADHPGHQVSCHYAESILAGRVQPAESLVVEAAVPKA